MMTISKAKDLVLKKHPNHECVQWASYKDGFIINAYPEEDEYHMVTLDPFFEVTKSGEVLPFSPVYDFKWFDSAVWNLFPEYADNSK